MADAFTATYRVHWGDLDFNGHMGNRVFLDVSGDSRMLFFAQHGFALAEFARRRFGPVIQKDELQYFRELRLMDEYVVSVRLAGLSPDGARFRIENAFTRADGKPCATVVSTGGWISLDERRLVAPPDDLRRAIEQLPHTDSFEALPALEPRRP